MPVAAADAASQLNGWANARVLYESAAERPSGAGDDDVAGNVGRVMATNWWPTATLDCCWRYYDYL